jgi:CRP/FNR family transcriptional regulator
VTAARLADDTLNDGRTLPNAGFGDAGGRFGPLGASLSLIQIIAAAEISRADMGFSTAADISPAPAKGLSAIMVSDTDIYTRRSPRAEASSAARSQDPDGMFAAVATQASELRLRRGQILALVLDDRETAFLIRSGALVLDLTLPGTPRQVVDLLLPGDVLRSSFVPADANARLTAMSATEVWRLRWSVLKALAGDDPTLAGFLETSIAAQMARQALHIATIGRLTGEQRVATVLTDLALRSGITPTAGKVGFNMPFSRRDIADYLGLNPDTLSRIISGLRSQGILARSERRRTVVRDVRALAALTPAAQSLTAITDSNRRPAVVDAA